MGERSLKLFYLFICSRHDALANTNDSRIKVAYLVVNRAEKGLFGRDALDLTQITTKINLNLK